MAKTGIYVGLDIGTTSVKVVVAEYIEGQLNIIGVGNAKSEGLSRGIIIDIDKAANSIKRAINQAEEKSGINIRSVNVGLPANLLEVAECEGMIAVNTEAKEITDKDVYNVAAAAVVRATPPERQVISLIPKEFKVDGFEGIQDPRGMIGVRLDMSGLVYTGPKTIVHNICKCVEKAGLQLDKLVITPLALSESILSEGEKDFGTTVIDMGGGQTTTSVMFESDMRFTHVEQEGGEFITKDISVVLNTSLNNAEFFKVNYGDAYPANTSEEEEFPVEVVGQDEPVKVDERYLSEIIEARMEQIFNKAKKALAPTDALNLPGGIILTGGNASLPGVIELASEVFGTHVKLYVPNHMGLRNPIFSNAISIVEYGSSLDDIYELANAAVTGETIIFTSLPEEEYNEESQPMVQESYVPEKPVKKQKVKEKEIETDENNQGNVKKKLKGFLANIFD
ncbi:cell division protein FtsA [Vagococcus intermedius]|uniref:Cell division protein FtsA n=1 Tax=Vagococcus intermedius TaxID=2991418 RepID=A0AAF0I813_9ENTE|nr:cell division protein FtsA [Vagococcus intermedius]WEG73860.1 cell division protein FtsA [Vagococcus intermedius]WEG75945.1 cell division protein FtsA [Vagococcus intermedius]